jgi:hypothetical protein
VVSLLFRGSNQSLQKEEEYSGGQKGTNIEIQYLIAIDDNNQRR